MANLMIWVMGVEKQSEGCQATGAKKTGKLMTTYNSNPRRGHFWSGHMWEGFPPQAIQKFDKI